MARAEDLRALEALTPWELPAFRSGLAALGNSAAQAARQFAADVHVLASLAAMVPRCPRDDQGGTPWTSFGREVAVARRVSDRAAGRLVRAAVSLTADLPVTLGLLETGQTTVERAGALVRELEPCDSELARRVDRDLGVRAASLPPWRIVQEVRRAVQSLDPEAAAHRASVKNAARGMLLEPGADDQACVSLFGPAVALTRWHSTLDERAHALRQAGDARPLDALRFDLATSTFPCAVHPPADATTTPVLPAGQVATPVPAGAPDLSAGLRPAFVEAAPTDCRASRPVQAHIVVPVESALGLSNDPAWLEGYGWISAPASRQLLIDAELRQLCAQSRTGRLVDLSPGTVRPPATPDGVRFALLDMVLDDATLTGAADRTEPEHDPSEPLRRLVSLRDRTCDGPTGSRVSARRCHLDHTQPFPHGPTAAWNLAARGARTHQLKHYGWIPLRTPTATVWTSPAGQVAIVPHHVPAPPGIDRDQDTRPGQATTNQTPTLPDPHELDLLDRGQLEAPSDDGPPWLPTTEQDTTTWSWLNGDDDIAC